MIIPDHAKWRDYGTTRFFCARELLHQGSNYSRGRNWTPSFFSDPARPHQKEKNMASERSARVNLVSWLHRGGGSTEDLHSEVHTHLLPTKSAESQTCWRRVLLKWKYAAKKLRCPTRTEEHPDFYEGSLGECSPELRNLTDAIYFSVQSSSAGLHKFSHCIWPLS